MKLNKLYIYSLGLLLLVFASCSEDRIDGFQTGSIKGIVVASGSNEVLQDVKISTQPATSTVFTDSQGMFTLDNVPEGTYSVQADKEDYLSGFEAANVLANGAVEVIFELNLSNSSNTPPSTPLLIAPENNSEDLALEVEFEWEATDNDDTDTLEYTLILYNDSNSDVLEFTGIEENTFTVEDGLNFGTKYFWQISVVDGVNPPVLSELFSFKTTTSPELDYLFVRKVGDNNVIYSGDNLGNEFALTSSGTNSWRPRRNTETGKIAFLRSVGGAVHLFTMNEDGSGQFQVTNSEPVNGFNFDEVDFAWSPSGDRFLYPSFEKLYIINADGSGKAKFYETSNGNFITEVDWSRFNDIIAIKTNNLYGYNVEIYTIDISGNLLYTALTGQPGGAGGLDLNVDGSKLLYYYDESGSQLPEYYLQKARLYIYDNNDPTNPRDLDTGVEVGFNNIDPRFSPNENEVIYTQVGVGIGSTKNIYFHNFEVLESNFELLFQNASMADWEN
ncbi:carboxypeptidase regulatory-like domain-containing protein [Ulvibacter litoralis]|uniref:Carboxypeptidase regulatory-like domain-containing protein n=1 Tax=Ulvibacter litoralis TaxID=227084 RepID=A0A1G7GPN0_9FLAO|nr:carboxypeptidase regulatory-like domain-containing protein [Ulvibacter litoralis]GHC55552.1 hypothetical protein GCM10008083_19670 [Ulvibacter litoralis]SDE89939.1 Carboxypeptidase regulatory-like domain-containing protein [Ulvibacter litoralis]